MSHPDTVNLIHRVEFLLVLNNGTNHLLFFQAVDERFFHAADLDNFMNPEILPPHSSVLLLEMQVLADVFRIGPVDFVCYIL